MNFNPKNILLIHFGQLGDVVLSLPALKAVREMFPAAKITALIGKSAVEIIEITKFFDEEIIVDRVDLRDGKKTSSIGKILRLVREIRRRKFDFIIDLHSLPETNLLGFLSGGKSRLYSNRESRSLDRLGKFPVKPPKEDKEKHLTARYFDVLKPLGIAPSKQTVTVEPKARELIFIRDLLKNLGADAENLAGLFPGAGSPSRRWSLEKFAGLAKLLAENEKVQPVVFLGPEESGWRETVARIFPQETVIIDELNLAQLLAALSLLRVLVSNDTGVVHLGAIAGAPLVLVMDSAAPTTYLPLGEKLKVVSSGSIDEISVNEVYEAARNFLQ